MRTLNVKDPTMQAFRTFKCNLQADLDKELSDDKILMFVFSNFTRHVYADGAIIWRLPQIAKEPNGEEEPVTQEQEESKETQEEEKSVEPQEEEGPVDKATQIARLKEKAAKIASGEIDVELTAEDYKKYGLKPREK
jgi:hypothetical protein